MEYTANLKNRQVARLILDETLTDGEKLSVLRSLINITMGREFNLIDYEYQAQKSRGQFN